MKNVTPLCDQPAINLTYSNSINTASRWRSSLACTASSNGSEMMLTLRNQFSSHYYTIPPHLPTRIYYYINLTLLICIWCISSAQMFACFLVSVVTHRLFSSFLVTNILLWESCPSAECSALKYFNRCSDLQ